MKFINAVDGTPYPDARIPQMSKPQSDDEMTTAIASWELTAPPEMPSVEDREAKVQQDWDDLEAHAHAFLTLHGMGALLRCVSRAIDADASVTDHDAS